VTVTQSQTTVILSGGPAFTSLNPTMPSLAPASAEVAEAINHYCGESVTAHVLGTPSQAPEGRYLIEREASPRRQFLKIFPSTIATLQAQANEVAQFLYGRGVPVTLALDHEPRAFDADHHGMLFPFIDARFANREVSDLTAVGRIIALAQAALLNFPGREDVMKRAAQLHTQLEAIAHSIVAREYDNPEFETLLYAAADHYLNDLEPLITDAQMVHSDCNYTNVLFDTVSGEATLIDFEESLSAWLSPGFDLALALQRFVLVTGHREIETLATHLIEGYFTHLPFQLPRLDLRTLCLWPVYRSVLILVAKLQQGQDIPASEWTKFATVAAIVHAQQPLLDSLNSVAARFNR